MNALALLHDCPGCPTHILVSSQDVGNVTRRELIQLLVVTEYYDSDIDRTQYRQLVSLLEQATLSLQKRPAKLLACASCDEPAGYIH